MDLPDEIKHMKFDIIICTEVIEHLYDPRILIRFCKRYLKNKGRLIITTPYHGYAKNILISLLGHWDAHFTALWDGGHIKFWSKNTLTKLLNEFNFSLEYFSGCGRVPYLWKSMILVAKNKE